VETVRANMDPALADRYSIERELGEGAMALVFLAHDLKHDRQVAIKVLKPELASAIGVDRFRREIEVVAGLTHPHILPLYDSGQAAGLLYYVMPYIEGESLRARLKREGRLPVRDAIRITREIADALGFAHRYGIIHRDVKPGNILLTDDHARLADFGIAHLAETESSTLTGTGLALGTPAYFSPEQATGDRDLDGRSDIYSLGCVLYEALTGQPPFTAKSVRALITQHLVDAPPQVRGLRPEVSEGVEAVVQTALRKEPEKRFQTAEEMAGSLDLISGGFEAIAAAALRKLIGPRHRWMHGKRLAALVTAAVTVLVAGALLLRDVLLRPAYAGTYPTYAILPYEGDELTDEERRLAGLGARELYWHLIDWESITVVDVRAMEGPSTLLVQAGLGLPTASVGAGLELADRINASHLIYVDANVKRDSVELVARIYPAGKETPERQLQAAGPKDDDNIVDIAEDLALQILGLHGEPATHDDLVSRSPYHTANQQFIKGRAALLDWRLAEAEEHFRAAVEEDPMFALAHYQLATTMYWRTVRDPSRILEGEVIHYHVERAHQFGVKDRLRPGERRDVNAFRSFWAGDYETARARYDSILETEPTSLDALVLAGAVEYDDPWLAEGNGDVLFPRGNLNRARALFDSAVALNSHEQLAWGRLFDVSRQVAETAYRGHCWGFQPPGGPPIRPYEFPEASEVRDYCPYVEDGVIHWLPLERRARERERSPEGVRQLQEDIFRRLEFWASVEKDQARPHEELADWMLWERSVPGCRADPVWSDSLLRGARHHIETALAIRGDTTPEDRVRFASILVATGAVPAAIEQTDKALAELGDWESGAGPSPPLGAANIYLAAGRAHPTAEILEHVWNEGSFAAADDESEDGSLAGGPVWGTLWALGALGLTDSDDADMQARFAVLGRTWGQAGYTSRQRALLHSVATSLISPALTRIPALWDTWFAGWEERGLEIPAVWKGLRAAKADPAAARLELLQARDELAAGGDVPIKAYDHFMPIVLAERLGEEVIAADLKRRARACPIGLDNVDLGWGMWEMLTRNQED